MSKHRRAAKRDSNEREIIEALQELGAYVIQESNVDLYTVVKNTHLITPEFLWLPMEVKTPKGRLTDYQIKLHGELKAIGFDMPIVQTENDALRVIGAID